MPQLGSPPATGTVRLGDMFDVDGSEGALSNSEKAIRSTLPVVGDAGSFTLTFAFVLFTFTLGTSVRNC